MSYLKKLLRALKKRVSFQASTRSELLRINAKVVALRASLEQSVKNFEGASALGERRAIDISDVRRFEIEQNLSNHFENRLMSLNEALVRHIEIALIDTQTTAQAAAAAAAQATAQAAANELLTQKFALLRREIDALRVPSTPSTNVIETSTERKTPTVDPTIYAAIEEHFRGSQELISIRQKSYLPYLNFAKEQKLPVLDLGCGRGEWLEILKNEDFNCEGVDTNPVFLNECTQKGLSTTNIDLLSFLSSQSSPRFGAITLFQVAEHLPFNVLVEVFRAARKCLVSGGVFIVETPNSKNLRVGAGTFWIDPTHERPLYPELLEFLSQLVGFEKHEAKYSASNVDLYDYSDAQPHTRAILEMLTLAVDGPADYALIATA